MTHLLVAILFAIMPACPTEDSTDCKWDARAHGNGQGRSFIAIDNGEGLDPAIIFVRQARP